MMRPRKNKIFWILFPFWRRHDLFGANENLSHVRDISEHRIDVCDEIKIDEEEMRTDQGTGKMESLKKIFSRWAEMREENISGKEIWAGSGDRIG